LQGLSLQSIATYEWITGICFAKSAMTKKRKKDMKTEQKPTSRQPHIFDPLILREYDIRGIVGQNVTDADAWAIGASFGTMVRRAGGNRVVVGFDGRHSSPALSAAVCKGLKTVGVNIERLPLGPTPMTYFAAKDRQFDGAIMITGSHNPSEYNGFKMVLQNKSVFGDMIQEIGRIAANADWETGDYGTEKELDIREDYVNRLYRDFVGSPFKTMNIAWDAGNGATGAVLRDLVNKLPGTHHIIYDEVDGDFPNHHPDPTVDKNLVDLQALVKEKGCDLGIAFDGDGDRIGIVDEKGDVIRCDTMIIMYAKDVLARHKGATIVGDVKCSPVMYDQIKAMGGNPIMWKTGHSLIKTKMADEKSPLSGELSGHIFFADSWYGFDDGLYCAIRMLNVFNQTEGPLSSLTADLPKLCSTPEVRLEIEETRKFETVDKLAKKAKAEAGEGARVIDIDGVRVEYDYGWWLLRASNTQNALTIRMEATSEDNLTKIYDSIQALIRTEGLDLTNPL
jgi:phosphomannomutase